MIKPRFLLSLILIAVLAVACSPATSTATSAPLAISSTQIPPSATAKAETMLQATLSPSETLAPTPFPIVTSRGPHLEATDPKTVSMAAGGLQFVEFFEFW